MLTDSIFGIQVMESKHVWVASIWHEGLFTHQRCLALNAEVNKDNVLDTTTKISDKKDLTKGMLGLPCGLSWLTQVGNLRIIMERGCKLLCLVCAAHCWERWTGLPEPWLISRWHRMMVSWFWRSVG